MKRTRKGDSAVKHCVGENCSLNTWQKSCSYISGIVSYAVKYRVWVGISILKKSAILTFWNFSHSRRYDIIQEAEGDKRAIILDNLRPGTRYRVHVTAVTSQGRSNHSDVVLFDTDHPSKWIDGVFLRHERVDWKTGNKLLFVREPFNISGKKCYRFAFRNNPSLRFWPYDVDWVL